MINHVKVDIDKLLELEERSDPGPWEVKFPLDMRELPIIVGEDRFMPGKIDIMYYRNPVQNMELISAMRNNIRALCEELKAARKIVDAVKYFGLAQYTFVDGDGHANLERALKELDEVVK